MPVDDVPPVATDVAAEPAAGPVRPTPSGTGIIRAVSWMGVGQIGTQAAWYGSLLLLAAILPPAAFGTVALGMVVVQVAWYLIDAGTVGAIVVAPSLSRRQIVRAVGWNIVVAAALGGAVALAAGPIVRAAAEGGDPQVLQVLALSIVVYALAVVPLALIQKALDFRRYAVVMATSATVAGAAGVALGLGGAGVWALVVRQIAYQALIVVLAWTFGRRYLPQRREGDERRGGGLRPGPFFVLTFANFLAMNVDYVVIGHFGDATTLGVYALAYTIAFAPATQFASAVGRVFLSATAATPDLETIGTRTVGAMRMLALALVPLVPPAIVLAPPVLPRLFGSEWTPMVLPFQILLVSGTLLALVELLGNAIAGAGRVWFRAAVAMAWLLAMTVLVIPLVDAYGIRGAAVAHLATMVPMAAIYLWWGSRRAGVSPGRLSRALAPIALAVAVQSAITAFAIYVGSSLGAPDGAARGIAAVAGLAAAGIVLRLHPRGPLRAEARIASLLAERMRARRRGGEEPPG